MKIRLTRKLAETIDGIDLERRQVGDVFDVSDSVGRLLIAERWAVACDEISNGSPKSSLAEINLGSKD